MKRRLTLWLLAGFVVVLMAVAAGALMPGSAPAVLLGLALTLWIAASFAVLLWYIWRWLTYRVSVRLLVSYLLLGVLPFLICAALDAFTLYLAMGQYTSVRYGSELDAIKADLRRDCETILEAYETGGEEAASEAFQVAVGNTRRPVPNVLWRARLGGLTLISDGSDSLPDLGWLTGEISTLARDEDSVYVLVSASGSSDRDVVAALVPLDADAARAISADRWYDVYFATLDEDSSQLEEDGLNLTVNADTQDDDGVRVNTTDVPVGEVWDTWNQGDQGVLHKPWVYWFRLGVEPRNLVTGEPDEAVISLLRTSPMNVWKDFTQSKYELGTHLWGALVGMSTVFLVLYGFALVIAASMIVSITRSTSRLTRGARAVELGNLDYRIPVKRHDQLGDLAASFNRMSQSVQDMLSDVAEKERLAKELELAREIQESLLPDRHQRHGPLSVHAIFRPAAAVGGDYFDIFPIDERRLVVVVGDVAGHGLHAGLLMASLKSTVAAMVREGYAGVDLVSRVNALLLERRAGPTMATLAVIEIDTEADLMRLTNAGHPPGYLIFDGEADELMVSSLPLGSARSEPRQIERAFPPGARLLLYSDGLAEATNRDGDPFTYERLARVVVESVRLGGGELESAVLAALDRHVEDRPLEDDLTVLVVERGSRD